MSQSVQTFSLSMHPHTHVSSSICISFILFFSLCCHTSCLSVYLSVSLSISLIYAVQAASNPWVFREGTIRFVQPTRKGARTAGQFAPIGGKLQSSSVNHTKWYNHAFSTRFGGESQWMPSYICWIIIISHWSCSCPMSWSRTDLYVRLLDMFCSGYSGL